MQIVTQSAISSYCAVPNDSLWMKIAGAGQCFKLLPAPNVAGLLPASVSAPAETTMSIDLHFSHPDLPVLSHDSRDILEGALQQLMDRAITMLLHGSSSAELLSACMTFCSTIRREADFTNGRRTQPTNLNASLSAPFRSEPHAHRPFLTSVRPGQELIQPAPTPTASVRCRSRAEMDAELAAHAEQGLQRLRAIYELSAHKGGGR